MLELNQLSASALPVGIEPDFWAAAAKAYLADLAGSAPLLKSKPSNFRLAPVAVAAGFAVAVGTAYGLAPIPVWTPLISLLRKDVNSSVDSSPLPLLSTVRFRDRAISWMDAPGWSGFMRLRSWARDQSRGRPDKEQAGCPGRAGREIRGFRVQPPREVSPARHGCPARAGPGRAATTNLQAPT